MSPWRLKPVGKSKNDSLPLDFGLLEIDEKTHSPAGGPQIVETLGGVLNESRLVLSVFICVYRRPTKGSAQILKNCVAADERDKRRFRMTPFDLSSYFLDSTLGSGREVLQRLGVRVTSAMPLTRGSSMIAPTWTLVTNRLV